MNVPVSAQESSTAAPPSLWFTRDDSLQQAQHGSVNFYPSRACNSLPFVGSSTDEASLVSLTSSVGTKRSQAKKRKSNGAVRKRKRDGKLARVKLFSKQVERTKKRLESKITKNVNNSKTNRRRSKRNSSKSFGSENSNKSIVKVYIPAKPREPLYAPPMTAAGSSGASPQFTSLNVPVGNPSIMPSTLFAMYGSSPPNLLYPPPGPCSQSQSMYPYYQQQPCGQQFPGLPAERSRDGNLVYKPVCREFPLALGCGRWYRLQRQEDAKKEGFLPLLRVMFCCCCNETIEVQEEE